MPPSSRWHKRGKAFGSGAVTASAGNPGGLFTASTPRRDQHGGRSKPGSTKTGWPRLPAIVLTKPPCSCRVASACWAVFLFWARRGGVCGAWREWWWRRGGWWRANLPAGCWLRCCCAACRCSACRGTPPDKQFPAFGALFTGLPAMPNQAPRPPRWRHQRLTFRPYRWMAKRPIQPVIPASPSARFPHPTEPHRHRGGAGPGEGLCTGGCRPLPCPRPPQPGPRAFRPCPRHRFRSPPPRPGGKRRPTSACPSRAALPRTRWPRQTLG